MKTYQIGDIPIASIQSITFSDSTETTEIDLVDREDNIVFGQADEAKEVDIEFTLVKQSHPEHLGVEKQEDEVKTLASQDVKENIFTYENAEYFLAIGDVSIPESSDMQPVREGTMTAKLLPWPKHYPEADRGVQKRMGSGTLLALHTQGDAFRVKSREGDVDYQLDMKANWGDKLWVEGGHFDLHLNAGGDLSNHMRMIAHATMALNVHSRMSAYINRGGELRMGLSMGQLETHKFGQSFGRSFGGTTAPAFGRNFGQTFGSGVEDDKVKLSLYGGLGADGEMNLDVVGYFNGREIDGDILAQLDILGDFRAILPEGGSVEINYTVEGDISEEISVGNDMNLQLVVDGDIESVEAKGYGSTVYGNNYGG